MSKREIGFTLQDAANYEIHSTWWVGYISSPWLRKKVGLYFARKARRKFKAYTESVARTEALKACLTKAIQKLEGQGFH